MDKISEILNSVKDRLSNPLIFSFLVSWLIYNWKIPVALIWFDEKQISANGCNSIFEFIEDEWKRNGYFWFPFGIALLYTFGFPIVKNLISAAQTWALKWGDTWNLNISKGGKVSVEKYISLLEIYDIKTQQLDQIINRENQTLHANKELHRQHVGLHQEIDNLKIEIRNLENFKRDINNYNFMYGLWELTYKKDDGTILVEDVNIFENQICPINEDFIYVIFKFFKNGDDISMFLTLLDGNSEINGIKFPVAINLGIVNENTIDGFDNNGLFVQFKRK